MHLESLLKNGSTEDFTCNLCNNILSYFPVYLTSDCQNVCGRCTASIGNLHFRNTIYEKLSQAITFPCRFKDKGCSEELLPEEVPEHETCCKFRTISCFLLECRWEGPCPNFLDHCKDAHSNMFLTNKDSFEVDLTTSFHITKLLKNEEIVFVSEMKFHQDKKKLQIAIYYPRHETGIDKNYVCQLCLQTGTNYPLAHFYTTRFEDISFTDVYPNLGKDRLSCYISFKESSLRTEDKEQQTTTNNEDKELQTVTHFEDNQLNPDLLSVLKCLSCSLFALPPIYQCSVAKSALCSSCKTTHNCQNCIQDRNITLDKLASLINYPCTYKERGCNFVATPSAMMKHFDICQYTAIACPLTNYTCKCAWTGPRKDMENHIRVQHGQGIEADQLYLTFDKRMDCYILKRNDHLFLFEYVMEKRRYCWKVQVVRCERGEIFEYQMEISHSHLPHKVLVSKPCRQLEKKKGTYDFDYVNIDQVGDNVRFKVTIL